MTKEILALIAKIFYPTQITFFDEIITAGKSKRHLRIRKWEYLVIFF
jgi:hypothetical protein